MDNFAFYSPLVASNITGDSYLFTMLLDIVKKFLVYLYNIYCPSLTRLHSDYGTE